MHGEDYRSNATLGCVMLHFLPKSRFRISVRPSTRAISLNPKNGISNTKHEKPTAKRPFGFHPRRGGMLAARVFPCHIPTAMLSMA